MRSLHASSPRLFVWLLLCLVPNGAPTVKAQETVRPIPAPATPIPPEAQSAGVTRFSFLVYGDTRGRRDGQLPQHEHSLVVDSMLSTIRRLQTTVYPVTFVLQSGDAVVDGSDAHQWNASFIEVVSRLTVAGNVPYFLAPGNHDVSTALTADAPERQTGLRNFLSAMSQLIPPDGSPRRLDGYPVFAFGYGNTFVLALDSNIAGDDKQFAWTRAQLEGLDRTRFVNVIEFLHHPPFSSGPHGAAIVEPQASILREKYMPLFRTHHVKAIFAGHEHLFEHWVERYEDATGRYRMDQVVSGGGGAPLYNYRGEPDTRTYERAFQANQVRLTHLVKPGGNEGDNPYHYVIVEVDGAELTMNVVGVDWGVGFKPYRSATVDLQDR